jgi:hypothetical protein
LADWKDNLAILLEEAAELQRIAVISDLYLPTTHNWAQDRRSYFEKYSDFSGLSDRVEVIPQALFQQVRFESKVEVSETTATESLIDNSAQLITRLFPHWRWYEAKKVFRTVRDGEKTAISHGAGGPSSIKCVLPGASSAWRPRVSSNFRIFRRYTFGAAISFSFRKFTEIEHVMKFVRARVKPQTVLFIMSNEDAAAYFAPFYSEYKVVRYNDFPEFVRIREIEKDSFLLFAVEIEIFRKAAVRIGTHKDSPYSGTNLIR